MCSRSWRRLDAFERSLQARVGSGTDSQSNQQCNSSDSSGSDVAYSPLLRQSAAIAADTCLDRPQGIHDKIRGLPSRRITLANRREICAVRPATDFSFQGSKIVGSRRNHAFGSRTFYRESPPSASRSPSISSSSISRADAVSPRTSFSFAT